ncbi:unnamed protein product [Calicophoron daubneyi]|uniref:Methyltransferase-like protein 17, mitochondrial n=1 Tax=Calicophoron daubneyi TaxID=300641 RepID=A0AAV2TF00_CALDB
MDFTARIVNGSLRYRAAKAVSSLFRFSPQVFCDDDASPSFRVSMNERLRQHPAFLSLPPLPLPAQLDSAAINFLRENSLSTPKSIEARAQLLADYLWSRPLPSEEKIIRRKLDTELNPVDIEEVRTADPGLADALAYHHVEELVNGSARNVRNLKAEAIEEWKSLTYSGHNCELYLVARLAPNFASTCRALYEIRKRCPKFIPRNLFDFGSGLGTVTWAANTVWPVGCVKEHYMVEPSADMTHMSEFMFQKNFAVHSSETVFPGIYLRRFLPSTKQTYDLVVSAYSMIELPGTNERRRVLSNLWDRTAGFLVLIEQGTKAGFSAIMEARDWLMEVGGDDIHIFAPCPHKKVCGKKDAVCNTIVRFYQFGLTQDKNEPQNELLSYLIVSRGDWRRYQVPVVPADSQFLPRVVSFKTGHDTNVTHDICLPSGSIERTVFPKKQTDKSLYFFLRHAKAGDIVPCEPVDCDLTEDNADQNDGEETEVAT